MTDALSAAAAAVDLADGVITAATRHLAELSNDGDRISVARLDQHQVLAYDLAHAASAVEGCRVMLDYGGHGELESKLARVFIADAYADLATRIAGRDATWGAGPADLAPAHTTW